MRPSQKSNRSRGKSNRSKSLGNVVNRVFESAGPEGKVRGTPQQIIDKYEQLARDAQTSGDRVVAENFLQHAEHYARMLSTAQAEQQAQQAKRDAEQERQQQNQGQQGGGGKRGGGGDGQGQQDGGGRREREEAPASGGGLQTIDTRDDDASPLVSTPEQPASEEDAQPRSESGESQGKPKPARRRRARRSDKGGDGSGEGSGGDGDSGGGQDVSGEAVSG